MLLHSLHCNHKAFSVVSIIAYHNSLIYLIQNMFLFLKDCIYLFLERQKGKEKERERNMDWLPLSSPGQGTLPTTQACAVTRLNWRPFGSQTGAESTEPHHPGLSSYYFTFSSVYIYYLRFLFLVYKVY